MVMDSAPWRRRLLAVSLVIMLTFSFAVVLFPRSFAAFPGLNGRIAFTSTRGGTEGDVYVMSSDGSGVNRLTYGGLDSWSSWSPDGSKISFASERNGQWDIYVIGVDGSGETRLTDSPQNDFAPAWSPDGSKIAFTSNRDGGKGEIYVMNADGTGPIRLTANTAEDLTPAWSPDGSKIAFVSDRDGNLEIYVMNPDGTGQTRLTNNPAPDSFPDWSPDSSKIAFAREDTGTVTGEIFAMNADGSGLTQLTNNAVDGEPHYSPDGNKIAFASKRDGNQEVYLMNTDGTNQVNISNNPGYNDWDPDWQPIVTPSPKSIKQDVLADLMALRATVTDKKDGMMLDDAIKHLRNSLDPSLWVDDSHLNLKRSQRVFQEEKDATVKLLGLIKDKKSTVDKVKLQDFINDLLKADRTLASGAIDDAVAAGAGAKKAAKVLVELAKVELRNGDQDASKGNSVNTLEHYRNAWDSAQLALLASKK